MKRFMSLLLALFAVFGGALSFAQDEAVSARIESYLTSLPKGYGVTKLADFSAILLERTPVLLDVREVEEYEAGHIEGSFNVPIRTLTDNLALLPDKSAEIMVICKGGARAALAMASLQILGYENVKVLAGGFDAWVAEEFPVTTEAFVPEAGTAPEIDPAVFASVDDYLKTLPQGYGLVSATNFAAELVDNPPALLLDVRSAEEVGKGYIDGSTHIWIEELWSRWGELPTDKDTPIVVYCQGGWRGSIATVALRVMGYTNVRNLAGGVNGWVAAKLPLVGAFDITTMLTDYLASLPENYNAIRSDALTEALASENPPIVVDVRSVDEFAEGHIAGAINIPLGTLTDNLAFLPDQSADIVIVCGSGHRSALATLALNLLGYSKAQSLLVGMGGWTGAGLPVTQETVLPVAGTAPTIDGALFGAVDSFIKSIPGNYWVIKAADFNVELAENAPALLLDVRTDGEWSNGYIEGAVHIPFAQLMTRLAELPADKAANIVVYDNPTHRSSMAMSLLRMLGYSNVRTMGGGVGAWEKAGLPLVK